MKVVFVLFCTLLLIFVIFSDCSDSNRSILNGISTLFRKSQSKTLSPTFQLGESTFLYHHYFSDIQRILKPVVPQFQRELNLDRVDQFYYQILNYRNNRKSSSDSEEYTIPYLNFIHFGLYRGEYLLIDGQHRFRSYEKFFNENKKDFKIPVVVIDCNNDKDTLKTTYRNLNDHFNQEAILVLDDQLDACEIIKKYARENYQTQISQSLKPRWPNINLDQLVRYVLEKYTEKNLIDMNSSTASISYSKILDFFKSHNDAVGKELQVISPSKYQTASNKQKLFLADAVREFVQSIESANNNIVSQRRVPQALRNKLWRQYFNNLQGECFVCNSVIMMEDFEAGHVIPACNGGTTQLQNLRPICKSCNRSCGARNLNEFKEKYFATSFETAHFRLH